MSNASVARAMQAAPPIGGAPRLDPERMLLTGQDAGGNASVAGFAQQTMQRAGGGRTAGCAPPPAMTCPPATSCPAGVINQVAFPVASSVLTAAERADIASVAAAWHAAGSGIRVRVDGYASVEGRCDRNWLLSCRRAQAVAAELEHPTGGVPGVPRAFIDVFAHGGTSEFSPALPPNRIATISIPGLPPTPPTPPTPLAPACALPVLLGANDGGCRKDPDFGHFDFPKITTSSEAKLTAWAYHLHGRPFRSWVTNFECELELDIVLRGLAGGEGHAAFAHFAAGTGRDVEHRTGSSTLANLATASPSFRATLAKVKKAIEEQLRDQAAAGAFDPCALSLQPPPETHFTFADGTTLKAVIGGTQGESVFLTRFTGSISARTYSLDLEFEICDDFGVDEDDLYAPGLFAFWVLQHERSATRYAPFVHRLVLTATLSGAF